MIYTKFRSVGKFSQTLLAVQRLRDQYPRDYKGPGSIQDLLKLAQYTEELAMEAGFVAREDTFHSNRGFGQPMAPALRVMRDYAFNGSFDAGACKRVKLMGKDFSRIFNLATFAIVYSRFIIGHGKSQIDHNKVGTVISLLSLVYLSLYEFLSDMAVMYQLPHDKTSPSIKKIIEPYGGGSVKNFVNCLYGDISNPKSKSRFNTYANQLSNRIHNLKAVLIPDSKVVIRDVWHNIPSKGSIPEIKVMHALTEKKLVKWDATKRFIEDYLKDSTHIYY